MTADRTGFVWKAANVVLLVLVLVAALAVIVLVFYGIGALGVR